MKKILTSIIFFSLICLVIGIIVHFIKPIQEYGNYLFWLGAGIGQLSGLILYLTESKIYKSKYFTFIIIGLSIFVVASFFKINHWPGSLYLFLFSLMFIIISYLIRFILKKPKTIPDFSKFFWLLTASTAVVFKISHWPFGDLITYISSGILWMGLLYILFFSNKISIKN